MLVSLIEYKTVCVSLMTDSEKLDLPEESDLVCRSDYESIHDSTYKMVMQVQISLPDSFVPLFFFFFF